MPISTPSFRAAGVIAGFLLFGLAACAPRDSAPLVTPPPASELSTPAPGASAPTPARGTAGMTMQQMMAHCAEMRQQGHSPAAMTPAVRAMMAQCDAMDRAHGQPAPSGRGSGATHP